MSTKNTVYEEGKKVEGTYSLNDAGTVGKERKRVAWVSLVEPTDDELALVTRKFGLEVLAAKGKDVRGQAESNYRERRLALTLSPARYADDSGTVDLGEFHVHLRGGVAVTVSRGVSPDIQEVEKDVEAGSDLSRLGEVAVLYAALYQVLEGYGPVVDGLGDDLTGLEADVLGQSSKTVKGIHELMQGTYNLLHEVTTFQHATGHLADILDRLADTDPWDSCVASDLERRLRGARSRARRIDSQVSGFASLLQNLLSINLTLVSVEQNDQTRKISAWAAILAVPTVIGGVYGTNFRHMPELGWLLGYHFALLVMAAVCLVLYVVFRRIGWL